MKKVNTYGIKMVGLRRAAGETRSWTNGNDMYVQISYDRRDGEILTNCHCSLGGNSWTEYHSHQIITVCNAYEPMTMQQIADGIKEELEQLAALDSLYHYA